jgi:hypothetical protein
MGALRHCVEIFCALMLVAEAALLSSGLGRAASSG